MTALQPNTQFAGRYQILRCIAAGGMGAVYEVIHLETERKRALKVMHAHFVQSEELRDRFKREAKVAAQIDSEFVVDVFDAGIDAATQMPFLVMELLKGEELGKRLQSAGRFGPAEAITYLWQTALALDKTHKANIVHRDLKPENLFLTTREDGPPRIKVLDFGVAKFVAETGTQGGQTRSLGTPLYMAPEQFRGQKVSPAADQFALSMMAYTLLVGEPYWSAEANSDTDIVAFALRAHSGPIEPASVRARARGVQLPAGFDAWFSRATASDPTARFPSATATVAALGQVFGINPTQVTGIAASDPLRQPTNPLSSSGPIASTQMMSAASSGPLTTAGAGLVQTNSTSGAPRSKAPVVALVGLVVVLVGGVAIWKLRANDARPAAAASQTTTTSTAAATSETPATTSPKSNVEVAPVQSVAPAPAASSSPPAATASESAVAVAGAEPSPPEATSKSTPGGRKHKAAEPPSKPPPAAAAPPPPRPATGNTYSQD